MDYKVELDVYSGPLDLLLHLVSRDELTIERIPVARIADQFVDYLENLSHIDIEVAGDFLVMAARLTEMKSRALLPQLPTDDEELDPDLLSEKSDLIQRLLEYRGFKEVSRWLRERYNRRRLLFNRGRFTPPEEGEEEEEEPLNLEGISVYDLFSAYIRIRQEVSLDKAVNLVYDDVPIEDHIELILERVEKEGLIRFSHLMPPTAGKLYIIGAFLALLELIRQHRVAVDQEEDFGTIRVQPKPPAPEEPPAEGTVPASPPPAESPEPVDSPSPEAESPAPAQAPGPENKVPPAPEESAGHSGPVDGPSSDSYDDPEASK
ncbi:MAG: segregation and condensation protein A [Planctomycetota bacterium]|jgi:segregation and condensation protein A